MSLTNTKTKLTGVVIFSIVSFLFGLQVIYFINCARPQPTVSVVDTTINHLRSHYSTLHIAFGLSGNHPGFLSEFEVAMKSVLLHAPLERDMHVHIIADREAYHSLDEIFVRTKLSTWITRNSIEIHAYDITPKLPELEKLILDTFIMGGFDPNINIGDLTNVHTLGAFFRLFAHHIISTMVKHIVYMDTDVVIMANLEAIWQQIETNTNSLFHWGLGRCSGFVILNVQRMSEIWRLAGASPMRNISATFNQDANDQLVLLSVNLTYPNEVAIFEDGWDMTVTEKWRNNHDLVERFPDVGMLHFNGARDDPTAYWTKHSFISGFPDTWGNGNYSAILPWPWARYQAKAMIHPGSKGHMMNITFWGTSHH